jgi:hypothetical protein
MKTLVWSVEVMGGEWIWALFRLLKPELYQHFKIESFVAQFTATLLVTISNNLQYSN